MNIEYGKDVAQPPKHLDVPFFEEVAENALRLTNLKLQRIQFTMGSSTGENYCSQIYRVNIQCIVDDGNDEVKNLSVIIKSMPHTDAVQFLQDLQVFLKEKITYNDVLPRMELFLEDSSQKFGARLLHSLKLPINTLVFEDLGQRNFEMASREDGLNEAHAGLVLRRLAQFHAISMILAKKDPDVIKCYQTGLLGKAGLERENSILMRFFGGNAAALIEVASSWPGYEHIVKKLETYVADLPENLARSQNPLPGELQVLNHGDLWVNNVLFKYDQKRLPVDVIFVDFQMSIWGSPGIDLNYFFFTSLSLDILKHKRDSLLKEYHSALCTTLRGLNYADLPSYQQIQQEFIRRAPFGFFANFGIYPTISMDKELSGDSSLDNFADEEFARNKLKQMFASKRLTEMLRYTLQHFDKLGIWD